MKAPDFWKERGGLGRLLAPLGWVYGTVSGLRSMGGGGWRAPVPVLCVGNLVAGGAGKTPVALELGRRLTAKVLNVHFLSRGYGGKASGPLLVDPDRHKADDVGDEPLLLAEECPTWVSANRVAGCRAAVNAGAELVIMDDGFQNPSLVKDESLIVVDGGYGFGNGRVMPAGPLREPLRLGLERATAAVLIGNDETEAVRHLGGHVQVLRARVRPGPEAAKLTGKPVVAFAGIGRPEKFFRTLREIGCDVRATRAFPDHRAYTRKETDELQALAKAEDAVLVTTAKDAVRLPPSVRGWVEVLTITLEWEDEAALETVLEPLVRYARS